MAKENTFWLISKFWLKTVVAVLYLVHYDTLLQNAIDIITECDNYFITKCDKSSLQNASDCLLQNATVLLPITTAITKCINFITKCVVYYKMGRYIP